MYKNSSPGPSSGAFKNRLLQKDYSIRVDIVELKYRCRGQWQWVLARLGIPEQYLSKRSGPCPCCGGDDRFSFDNKDNNGSFICRGCGPGDGFELLKRFHRWTFSQTMDAVANTIQFGGFTVAHKSLDNLHVSKAGPSESEEKIRSKLRRIWNESRPVTVGDPVWTYLTKTREIELQSVPDCLRYHPRLWYRFEDGRFESFPAMLAMVTGLDGTPVTLHRTYLTADGNKAPVPACKKLMKPVKSGALLGASIRLHPDPVESLGISEGIETAMYCSLATSIPTWAAISASLMPSCVAPEHVREVIIFADNDSNDVGQNAAEQLAENLIRKRKRVKVMLPPEKSSDWLDLYVRNKQRGNRKNDTQS
ncbi:MAG: toprim domain-containing protein [Cyanobacteria bacterium]|nr:toprim domain-containing protein [Cyanobacteriota bacterium]